MVRIATTLTDHARPLGTTQPLVGIVTEPTRSGVPSVPAFILSNSGIVHRVGPGRLYVKIARSLAAADHLVARIDHSGIGDSDPRQDGLPYYQSAVAEIREVMNDLASNHGTPRFAVLGLCSGAEVALRAACDDDRVVGVVLINGGGQTVSGAMNQHVLNQDWARNYWRRSFFRTRSWRRAVTGRIQYRLLAKVLGRQVRRLLGPPSEVISAADVHASRIRSLIERGVRVLIVCSEGDHALAIQRLWLDRQRGALARSDRLTLEVIPNTDHTFTFLRNQRDLIGVIERWAASGGWTDHRSGVEAASRQ